MSDNDKRFLVAALIVIWAMLIFSGDWYMSLKGAGHSSWEFYVIVGLLLFSGVSLLLVPIAANIERVVTKKYSTKHDLERGTVEVTDVEVVEKKLPDKGE